MWDEKRPGWTIKPGKYRVTLATSATDKGNSVIVILPGSHLAAGRGVRK